eukprot:617439-Prorocentrum_minimum.AAC.1
MIAGYRRTRCSRFPEARLRVEYLAGVWYPRLVHIGPYIALGIRGGGGQESQRRITDQTTCPRVQVDFIRVGWCQRLTLVTAPLHLRGLGLCYSTTAPLYHCTTAPLYRCTAVPLYHYTAAPLYRCTSVP